MTVRRFAGAHAWLSNFWLVDIVYAGLVWPSVEHAYQAAKTLDPVMRERIRVITAPHMAKKIGKSVVMRRDWNAIKLGVMEDLIRIKFSHSGLRAWLLRTGTEELIEGNGWGDTYWGVCRGVGENHLGKIVMKVRKDIAREVASS